MYEFKYKLPGGWAIEWAELAVGEIIYYSNNVCIRVALL